MKFGGPDLGMFKDGMTDQSLYIHCTFSVPFLYSSELVKLREVLDKWVNENDKGIYPESSGETEYWAKDAAQAYQQKMKKFNLDPNISDEEFLKWWKNRLLCHPGEIKELKN